MYNPTRWQTFKDILRCIFCRHKHTEVRTIRGGSDPANLEVLGRFVYCFDCRNNIGEPKQ